MTLTAMNLSPVAEPVQSVAARPVGVEATIAAIEMKAVRAEVQRIRRERRRVAHGLAGLRIVAMFPTTRLEMALAINAWRKDREADAPEAPAAEPDADAPVDAATLRRNAWLARLDEIDAELDRLREERKGARHLKPAKRRERVIRRNSAQQTVLNDSRAAIITALEMLDEEEWREQRRAEVAALEALRGGVVEIVEREVVTPLIKDGAEVWRRGKQAMVRERISAPVVLTRDGLQTLATAHLKSDGEPRMRGNVAMVALFTANQLAALERYRIDFEAGDAEWSLKAVDTSAVSGDRQAFDPARSSLDIAIAKKQVAVSRLKDLDHEVRIHAGQTALGILRAVAGEGRTVNSIAPGWRRAQRLTRELLRAADVLADQYGLR